MSETTLLATFTKSRHLNYIVNLIRDNFSVIGSRVFILKDLEKPYRRILTYNVLKDGTTFSDIVKNTISLHRKKDTNTLYTLNALNELVVQQNGTLDESYAVDWNEYTNCILLINKDDNGDEVLQRINTALIKVIKL